MALPEPQPIIHTIMNFKECQKDYTVYRLSRNGNKSVDQGKMVEASMPHIDRNTPGSMQMVIDATITFGDKTRTYVIPEQASIIYTPDNEVISTDIQSILQEVEADKARSEEALKMHDTHVENVRVCDEILERWNPALKEKRETDRRISALEDGMKGINDTMSEMLKLMKKNNS